MQLIPANRFAVAGLLLFLTACAELPKEMRFYPAGADAGVTRLWPDLPEVPRYQYVGQLTGEHNFGPAERSEPGAGEKLLRWIVGLGNGYRQMPRVLVRPQSGMVDDAGRIYVTDAGRQALFVFDALQGRLHIWSQADRGESFADPVGVTQGPDGEILVTDATLHRVVRLHPDGRVLGSYGGDVLQRPTGIVFDPATHQVFVVDTRAHAVKVFDATGALVREFGGQGTAAGKFNAPTHIALAGGRLYVTDTLNARLQMLDLDGNPLGSIGRRGLYVGNLTRPKGVTVDADGNVYLVESYYDHLLVFNRDGEFLLPIGGTGAAIGQFFLPAGAWGDRQGRIFVADMYNGRVMIFQYLGG
ncbi:MAG: 6-bladed beta-propeller [Gammaproteobacteria bacterium]